MINLMFIKNISRLDTIRFENSDDRDNYFYDIASVSIDSIYPPHFQNRIQLSIEDLSPSTKVNYLSLFYEGKYYYYFIDDINYINEGLYDITITMDTIMTFMFDLNINKAILERHNIKRWNDNNTINRNYIRENISNSDNFINLSYTEYKYGVSLLVFKCRQEMFFSSTGYDRGCEVYLKDIKNGDNIIVNDGTLYLIFPLINVEYYTDYIQNINGFKLILKNGDIETEYQGIPFERYRDIVAYCMENPHVYDAFISTGEFANNLFTYKGYTTEDGNRYLSFYINVSSLNDNSSNYCDSVTFENVSNLEKDYLYPIFSRIHTNIFKNEYEFSINGNSFIKNNNPTNLFSLRFIPQLIDENYLKLYYGEKLGFTSYPLCKLNYPKLFLNSYYDIISNNRCYNITDNENAYDKYLTNIINQTKEYLPLYGDALANYQTTNYGTLTTGVALAKQNALWSGAKKLFNAYNQNNQGILQDASGNINKNQLTSSIGRYAVAIGDTAMEFHNIDMKLRINKENAEFSPDTIKQGNTFSSDLSSNSLNKFIKIDIINDIEYVAKKYEQYGYLVNKEVINVNLYEDFNTRLYYNVVKFNNIDIELNYINNQKLIQNIIARLENGLRLWNIASINIDDDKINYNYFNYDNVENDFIE